MQLYNGLPIITNKITVSEQRGIPHHLLGHIPLDGSPWDVDDFKAEAAKTIREIRGRGNLPILVGGTHYYVDPLLFPDVILDDVQTDPSKSFPILEESAEVMLQELRKVDPVMAEKWHPNDRRKIQRSLEIYLHTGRPASDLYAEQEVRKEVARGAAAAKPWHNLLFWVSSEREVLKERLDGRVDKMLERGLLEEVKELFEFKRRKMAAGDILDMTKGIWQSIGYKQFEPYLQAIGEGEDAPRLDELKIAALEDMKTATRRYANYQTKWIRLKQIPRLKDQGPEAFGNLYLLDSTDVSQFSINVVEPAAHVTAKFLSGATRPAPVEISELARDILTKVGEPPPKEVPCQKTCEICQTVCVTEQAWQRHIKGASHRRVLKKRNRLALVPVDREEVAEVRNGVVKITGGESSSEAELGQVLAT